MKVLLTGATGLLGGHILEELVKRNIAVKCLYRKEVPSYLQHYTSVDFIEGDITNLASLKNAIDECSAVIHAAADTSMLPSHSDSRIKINVEGTKNLIDLAVEKKVDRFVFIGSVNVFEYGTLDAPGDESERTKSTKGMPQYNETKIEGQKLVEEAIKNQGLKAIINTPCFMLGERDFKPSSGKMVQTILQQKLPFYTPGGKNVVYVKDVAIAVCNSLTMGTIGESYILGNQNTSYKDLFKKIADYGNVKAPSFKIPGFLIKFFGLLGTTKEKLFKKTPLFNLHMANASCQKNYYKIDKAIKELNMPQTSLDVTIQNTVNWFLKQEKRNS